MGNSRLTWRKDASQYNTLHPSRVLDLRKYSLNLRGRGILDIERKAPVAGVLTIDSVTH